MRVKTKYTYEYRYGASEATWILRRHLFDFLSDQDKFWISEAVEEMTEIAGKTISESTVMSNIQYLFDNHFISGQVDGNLITIKWSCSLADFKEFVDNLEDLEKNPSRLDNHDGDYFLKEGMKLRRILAKHNVCYKG